jgi:hypothetical protein
VQDSYNPRRDIEKILARGGGSFDALLDMLDGEPETPPMETDLQAPGSEACLPQSYRLEYGSEALILRRVDGSFVAAEEDILGWPAYSGPEEHARSARRLVKTRMEHPWERFLRTERLMLGARRRGQMARGLWFWRLPGESQAVLDSISSENRRRAEEGLVELRSEGGQVSRKHVEELLPEDRVDRIRAELSRIE